MILIRLSSRSIYSLTSSGKTVTNNYPLFEKGLEDSVAFKNRNAPVFSVKKPNAIKIPEAKERSNLVFENNEISPLTAAVSEVCSRKNASGRFLGFFSQLAETPPHKVDPGEETPGYDSTWRENKTETQ